MANIAFIGLGHMGNPMAVNLVKAQHNVKVFDISKDAMAILEQEGAIHCDSLADLATQDIFITMLQTPEQVKTVCLENGLFDLIKKQSLYIDCSSIDVDSSKLLHQKANEKEILCLDAPVSGGVAGALNAVLTFMVGGEKANFEKALPILQVMGKKIVHTGDAGTGQAAKICNNMILGISMIAISEAFSLAEKLGLKAEKLFEVSSNASGQCWAMTSYCPIPGLVEAAPSNNEFKPGFTANMMLKDLLLSQQAADTVNSSTELGRKASQLYSDYVKKGEGETDFSGIIKMIQKHR